MRMGEGRETFNRLLNWDRGQAPSERLAAIILSNEGFMGIDPSHPLGGKDGLKDMTLSFEGKRWIGAVYFPRGQQTFTVIKDKFIHDLDGVKANGAKGLVFVTNQELRLNERKILSELAPNIDIQIYHLERIASLLNTPSFYGIRMEFLDIEMSKEEQLSFFADKEQRLIRMENILERMVSGLDEYKALDKSVSTKLETDDDEPEEYTIEPRTMQNRFKAILKRCNLRTVNFHLLRHTYATVCIELGFDVKTLSELLGHADASLTLNRYVHSSLEQKKKFVERFSACA